MMIIPAKARPSFRYVYPLPSTQYSMPNVIVAALIMLLHGNSPLFPPQSISPVVTTGFENITFNVSPGSNLSSLSGCSNEWLLT